MSEPGSVDGTVEQKRKSPRWMKILLTVSLMLNVAVIGAIGARAWKTHKYGHGHHAMHALGVHAFLWKLPRERRKALREKFRQVRGELKQHKFALVQPLQQFAGALAASDYDRAKVEEAVQAFRASHEKRAAARERYILELVDALTPEERKMLGEKILERAERRQRWHKRLNDWTGKD
ncbi:MAG: periplasmic heavy metal sensor [Pseudomonadota bacterium]